MVHFIKALFHVASAGAMIWGFDNLKVSVLDKWIRSQTGGHFQFLTIQGLFVAFFAMVIGFVSDLVPKSNGVKRVKRALTLLGLPLSVTISAIYWPLVIFLPHMIMQKASVIQEPTSQLPEFIGIPLTVDLALHAAPALSLLFDFFAFESSYDGIGALKIVSVYGVGYVLWVEYCGHKNGTFPYPFLTENELPGRILIYCGALLLSVCSFNFINSIHKLLRRPTPKEKHM